MLDEQTTGHTQITASLQQCEVWLMGDVDTETAKTHLLDALDELHYQFNQLEQ
jgi:hypothetical protein